MNFGKPFFSDIFEGSRGCDGEANQEDVGLGVRKRTQSVVIFLTGRIEEAKSVWLVANPIEVHSPSASGSCALANHGHHKEYCDKHRGRMFSAIKCQAQNIQSTFLTCKEIRCLHHSDSIVIKNRRDVFGGKFVRCVGDKKAGLSNGAVTDNYTSITHQNGVST